MILNVDHPIKQPQIKKSSVYENICNYASSVKQFNTGSY